GPPCGEDTKIVSSPQGGLCHGTGRRENNGPMRLGVLDIGSNTVHLLLVDARPGANPVPFASHKRALSLVKYLDAEGNITDEGQHELIEFILDAWEFAAK